MIKKLIQELFAQSESIGDGELALNFDVLGPPQEGDVVIRSLSVEERRLFALGQHASLELDKIFKDHREMHSPGGNHNQIVCMHLSKKRKELEGRCELIASIVRFSLNSDRGAHLIVTVRKGGNLVAPAADREIKEGINTFLDLLRSAAGASFGGEKPTYH